MHHIPEPTQRYREVAQFAKPGAWRLQFTMTFEEAAEHGASWLRDLQFGVERIQLSAATIRALGRIPTGYEAYQHVLMDKQYERLANDRADIQRRLANQGH